MSGADLAKVTPQGQPLDDYGIGAGKTAADIMGPDVSVTWHGFKGDVSGNFPKAKLEGFSTDPEEQEGHYLAFELDKRLEGQEVTVIGAKETTASDRKWVVRLDELYESTKQIIVKAGGEEQVRFDLSKATMGA